MKKDTAARARRIATANRRDLIKAGLNRRDLMKLGLVTSAGYLVAKRGLSARASTGSRTVRRGPFIEPLRSCR
jgi:hypothetical protein